MAATNSLDKKLVSLYFDKLQYLAFQNLSKQKNCSTSDLIREAMAIYLKNQKQTTSFDDWTPLSVGGLKNGVSDWISKDYQEEMAGSSYDCN